MKTIPDMPESMRAFLERMAKSEPGACDPEVQRVFLERLQIADETRACWPEVLQGAIATVKITEAVFLSDHG